MQKSYHKSAQGLRPTRTSLAQILCWNFAAFTTTRATSQLALLSLWAMCAMLSQEPQRKKQDKKMSRSDQRKKIKHKGQGSSAQLAMHTAGSRFIHAHDTPQPNKYEHSKDSIFLILSLSLSKLCLAIANRMHQIFAFNESMTLLMNLFLLLWVKVFCQKYAKELHLYNCCVVTNRAWGHITYIKIHACHDQWVNKQLQQRQQ